MILLAALLPYIKWHRASYWGFECNLELGGAERRKLLPHALQVRLKLVRGETCQPRSSRKANRGKEPSS